VKEGYSEADNYVGVGFSEKSDKSERQAESESLAKKELTESIKVTIKSENDQSTRETNQRVIRNALSRVTATAEEDLRGLKIRSRWVDKETCKQYTLMVISKKSVEKSHLEQTMKSRLEKFKELLVNGTIRDKTPDINDRRKDLEDAQELLQETDFKQLTEIAAVNNRTFYEKQLTDAFARLNKEASLSKDRMAVFALNKDHNLNEGVIGKMLDKLRVADQSADRLMDGCDEEQECIKAAKNRGFTRLTLLISNCQVGVSQMGSLKGTLKVTKKVYDLDSRKVLETPRTMSAEVIGWSNEELDWSAAADKVMDALK